MVAWLSHRVFKRTLTAIWLQEVSAPTLRTVPYQLRALFPADKALLVPLETPAGLRGALAVSPPPRWSRHRRKLEDAGMEFAVELERLDRELSQQSTKASEADTLPPPAILERRRLEKARRVSLVRVFALEGPQGVSAGFLRSFW